MQYDIKEDLTLLTWRMSDPKMFINRICTLYSTGWFAGKQAATWFPVAYIKLFRLLYP